MGVSIPKYRASTRNKQQYTNDYIDLIKSVTPENKHLFSDQLYRCLIFIKTLLFNFNKDNFGEDSPVIERLYEFCCTYT